MGLQGELISFREDDPILHEEVEYSVDLVFVHLEYVIQPILLDKSVL